MGHPGFSDSSGEGILALQSLLFASLAGAHILVLRIIQELWQSAGGVFNVDEVLQQMVFGLEEELAMRMQNQLQLSSLVGRRPDDVQPGAGRMR